MIEIIGGPTNARDYRGAPEMAEKMGESHKQQRGCLTNGRDDGGTQQVTEMMGCPQMTEIRMPQK